MMKATLIERAEASDERYVTFICSCSNTVSAQAKVLSRVGFVRCRRCGGYIKAGTLEVLTIEDIEARMKH